MENPNWEAEGTDWFLRRVLSLIVKKHADTIRMGRCIMKDKLYREFSWWFRFSRSSTGEVLRLLVQRYPGIRLSNRGLCISSVYLDPKNWGSFGTAPAPKKPPSPSDGGAELPRETSTT